ncbi:hypothetical protein K443DRAFT_675024 [Laccaria amethystina LaAM-08-1]|uniref:Carbohydrate kinase PfkB domain-containing protein n=1 Tax=Laccaria amethystina LaAM-08-1 TaxID=1095629 RepID=A0A0C9Y5P6_9AGAR|nr:hypothetical protein K443DRAFT_675024 [Laccaria amethystina LaAM-08-1]
MWAQLASVRSRNAPLDIHPEVEEALATNKPVVALETALVSHGLPFPHSLNVPTALEDVVRLTGCVPATIGIIGGRIKIGLTRNELEILADRSGDPCKVSRRDIAAAVATKSDGGTTCSATLVFAAMAGIKIFATGGLGGVHRGGENTMDVSADLHELTRCPVGLVSAGVKSILDIGKTLEYLETLGVPTLTYGESREFPAFFSRHSGFKVPWNVNDPVTAAKVLHTQWQLGMVNGALIAVPIPAECEASGENIQACVNQAVLESEENGISRRGKDATPWLLNRVAELSAGDSLVSNIALLKNTALIGGQIAVQYQKLLPENDREAELALRCRPSVGLSKKEEEAVHFPTANVVVIGSAALDITAQADTNTNPSQAMHSTAPGTVSMSLGGVARNIAEASHRVMEARYSDLSSLLIAPVGNDHFGDALVQETSKLRMRTDGLVKTDKRSAVCNMVLNSGGALVGGVADMDITRTFSGDMMLSCLQKHTPSVVALDGNLSPESITAAVDYCNQNGIAVLFEPTSAIKSASILPAISSFLRRDNSDQPPITFFTPNLLELTHLYQATRSEEFDFMSHPSWWNVIDSLNLGSAFRTDLEQLARKPVDVDDSSKGTLSFLIDQGVAQMTVHLLPFFQHIFVKCGDRGVLVAMCIPEKDSLASAWARERSNSHKRYIVTHGKAKEIMVLQHFPALPIETVANVTGAGDSFVGALLASVAGEPGSMQHPKGLEEIVSLAQTAAITTLQSHFAVSPRLSELVKL